MYENVMLFKKRPLLLSQENGPDVYALLCHFYTLISQLGKAK